MLQEYTLALEKQNSVFSIVDADKIIEIEQEILSRQNETALERNHYIDNYYNFESFKNEQSINSIFIIATPSSFYILKIKYLEKEINIKIPPIYGNRNQILENIKTITKKTFVKFSFNTFPVILPKKLLAAYSGLAQYGNNGLVYVQGMGSYHRLTAFASDFKNDHYIWVKPSMMKSCQQCGRCVENCPSKALRHGIPWVNINRCITEFNEKDGIFPDWMHKSWHNCLIGCIKCQEICPHNNKKEKINDILLQYSDVEDIINIEEIKDLPERLKRILININMDRYWTCSRTRVVLSQVLQNAPHFAVF
ncbi:MAG: hypothetical protein LBT16_09675 [Treponema sp.]|jgi:epoxyqueuosine reductase|nr:hypothetical protein [Treponema sp.]